MDHLIVQKWIKTQGNFVIEGFDFSLFQHLFPWEMKRRMDPWYHNVNSPICASTLQKYAYYYNSGCNAYDGGYSILGIIMAPFYYFMGTYHILSNPFSNYIQLF